MPWNSWPLFARFNLLRAGSLRNYTIEKRSPPLYTVRETRSEFSSSLLAYLRLFCITRCATMLWNCGSLRSFFGSRDPLSLLFLRLAYDRLTYDACRIINIATRRSTLVRLGGSLLGVYLWTYFVLSGANSVYLWILIRREVEIAILKNYEILENFPPWIEKLFQAPLVESTLHVFANNRSGSAGPRSLIYLPPLLVAEVSSRPEIEAN